MESGSNRASAPSRADRAGGLNGAGAPNNGTFILQWHITHRCNLRCAHCYQDDYTAFESGEAVQAVLGQFQELLDALGMRGYLNVTGGEPLAHPDLFSILMQAKDLGLRTAVLTNGTLIGRSKARHLKACGVEYVQVSLDGMRATHDSIRGDGNFDAAMRGIRWLRAENIFTTVSFTAQQRNVKDFAKLAKHCKNTGVDKLWFDRVVIPIEEDHERLSLTPEQSASLFRKAAKLSRTTPTRCIRALQFLECEGAPVYRCTAGEQLLAVLANGNVMPCRRLPIVLGNVHDQDLLSMYSSNPDAIALREGGVPAACSSCTHAASCGGGAKCIAYARTRDYTAADPDCPLLR